MRNHPAISFHRGLWRLCLANEIILRLLQNSMSNDELQSPIPKYDLRNQARDAYQFTKANRNIPSKHWRHYTSTLCENQKPDSIRKYLKTQPCERLAIKEKSNPRKTQAMRIENIRLKTHERRKKNQQIFFRKRNYNFKTLSHEKKQNSQINNSFSCRKIKNIALGQDQSRKKLEETPFMLRRRSVKLEKKMNIINHQYQSSLNEINNQDFLKTSLNFQNQQSLINRMKGTKIYYHFVREWKFPKHEDI